MQIIRGYNHADAYLCTFLLGPGQTGSAANSRQYRIQMQLSRLFSVFFLAGTTPGTYQIQSPKFPRQKGIQVRLRLLLAIFQLQSGIVEAHQIRAPLGRGSFIASRNRVRHGSSIPRLHIIDMMLASCACSPPRVPVASAIASISAYHVV